MPKKGKSFTLNINAAEGKHSNGLCGPHGGGSAVYGLGFLGALVYYLTTATDLWSGAFGIVKAILWPAFLVHGVLKFLGA